MLKNDTVSSEYWLTMRGTKVWGVGSGYPPQELKKNQFPLTREQFDFLARNFLHKETIEGMLKMLRDIQKQMRQK